jgi:ubiquinol-cytochrome c reductase iron-sulfur subunit
VSATPEQNNNPSAESCTPKKTRRDFLLTWVAGFATVGTAFAIWPLIDSMNPGADVLASGAPTDVDLSSLSAGSQRVVKWRGLPLFVARRTPEELKVLQEPRNTMLLLEPDSVGAV